VRNPQTGAAYLLVPGANDGNASSYGVGDLWVLRYRSDEIDDGQPFTTDPALSRARIDNFRTPAEPVTDTDVVLWYSAHFVHDEAHGHPGGHYVGPDLRPENWPA
jgi:Cu2+-containing amine oxidase